MTELSLEETIQYYGKLGYGIKMEPIPDTDKIWIRADRRSLMCGKVFRAVYVADALELSSEGAIGGIVTLLVRSLDEAEAKALERS